MLPSLLLVLAAFGQLADDGSSSIPRTDPSFNGTIRAVNDQPVYAEADGLLTTLNVKEGSRMKKGDIIAVIDERNAQAAVEVQKFSLDAALERFNDTIEEQYAIAAAMVSKKDVEMALAATRNTPNVISEIDVEKKKLDFKRASLQIEKAKKDRAIAGKEADVKKAELDAAKVALERRTILAPFSGEVQELLVHEAEWCNPGDPILQLVQFDTMWVECMAPAKDYDPAELQGRPVTVRINLARGRQASVAGRIVYVSQALLDTTDPSLLDATDAYAAEYLVRAEVQNKRDGDFWLVRPGMQASMTIHVNQAPLAASQSASIE